MYFCVSYRFVEYSLIYLKWICSFRIWLWVLGILFFEVNVCVGKDDIESSFKVSFLFSDIYYLNKWMF